MTDSRGNPRLPPKSHREVIDLWPKLADFAADIGADYGTAKQMRRRDSIGDRYRPAVVAGAATRGIEGISYELLTRLAAGLPPKPARSRKTTRRVRARA